MSLEPYATLEQLKERWPDMPDIDDKYAQVLLADASTILRAQFRPGQVIDEDVRTMITCQMVRRALSTSTVPEGVTSVSQTVGPFATQMGFSGNSSNTLYLTRAEKRLLGIGVQRAGNIDLLEASTQTGW